MKRFLLLLSIFALSSITTFAQLQVKENSFKKVDGFVNINIEKMYDDNDKPYAVLKIKTENINDKQRRELGFGGDAQTFFETEYKDGEVWLYISYYATFLKISHPDLSSTEFWFPYDMEPKRGYELTLVNKPAIDEEIISRIEKLENSKSEVVANPDDFGYIVVKTGSLEGATVYIDGQEMEMKTPFVSDPIKIGPHKIKVVKDGYEAYQDIVAVEVKGMKTISVDLKKMKSTNLFRKKGLFFIPEVNVSPSLSYNLGLAIIPQLNLEYICSNKVGLGVDAGFIYTSTGLGAIPISGQISIYFNQRKTSPFINLKAGYLIGIIDSKSIVSDYVHEYHFTGLSSSATIGANINRSRIGVGIGIYHYELYDEYEAAMYENYTNSSHYIMYFGISYSYMIPFGKK